MIVDTSALLAILFDEPDAERYARALAEADTMRVSAGNFVEAAVVVEAQTHAGGRGQFDTLIRRAGIVKGPDFSKTDVTAALPFP
jgi:ribonuclease VapC